MKFIVLVIILIVAPRSWAGLDEGIDAYQRGDFSVALREFQPLAERGVAKAQFGLCLIYSRSQDYTHATDWCRRAAEQGASVAQSFLGEMYADGLGVSQDYREAASWYRKAAAQGYATAQVNLGAMYSNGQGVEQDYAEGEKWYRKAAEQADKDGEFGLALHYDLGKGVPQDHAEAVKWYLKAAEQGMPNAQHNLAAKYEKGEGVAQDYGKAVDWYIRAAKQGFADSQWTLGVMYNNGRGVSQDYKEAVEWYRKAADQGHLRAQHNLGALYFNGTGVPRDYVLAYLWLNLAAAHGDAQSGKDRDRVASTMSRSQIEEAQGLARQWKPKTEQSSESPGTPTRKLAGIIELEGTGSGFVITKDGLVLTNHHVIRDCVQVHIAPSKALVFTVFSDEQNDLALLQGSGGRSDSAVFRDGRGIRPGDEVIVMGYPLRGILASEPNVTSGVISALAGPGNRAAIMQITAPIQPGNSGGPVLDGSGHVVGVVVGKLNALRIAIATGDIPQNVNFAVSGSTAQAFLDSHGIRYQRAASLKKIDSAEIAETSQRFTVLVECWK